MMDRKLWSAQLASSSPRYAQWRAILESDDVPLLSPASGPAKLGAEGEEEVHLVDVRQLTTAQLGRLVKVLALKFRVDKEEVLGDILRDGHFPIRAADVIVSFQARAFL